MCLWLQILAQSIKNLGTELSIPLAEIPKAASVVHFARGPEEIVASSALWGPLMWLYSVICCQGKGKTSPPLVAPAYNVGSQEIEQTATHVRSGSQRTLSALPIARPLEMELL